MTEAGLIPVQAIRAFALCSLLTSPIFAISLGARTLPTLPISDFASACIRVTIRDSELSTALNTDISSCNNGQQDTARQWGNATTSQFIDCLSPGSAFAVFPFFCLNKVFLNEFLKTHRCNWDCQGLPGPFPHAVSLKGCSLLLYKTWVYWLWFCLLIHLLLRLSS